MDILHENSGLAVKLVKFFGKPLNIKTLFSNVTSETQHRHWPELA